VYEILKATFKIKNMSEYCGNNGSIKHKLRNEWHICKGSIKQQLRKIEDFNEICGYGL
jgi:hypothetical protein